MTIKNITKVSFLALMLGATGSFSSLSLATEERRDKEKGEDSYTVVKKDESYTKLEDTRGHTLEISHVEGRAYVTTSDPDVVRRAVQAVKQEDVKGLKLNVVLRSSAPESERSSLLSYAENHHLPVTTDENGNTSVSGAGSAVLPLVRHVSDVTPAPLPSPSAGKEISGNTLGILAGDIGNTTTTNGNKLDVTLTDNNTGGNKTTTVENGGTYVAGSGNIMGSGNTLSTGSTYNYTFNITMPAGYNYDSDHSYFSRWTSGINPYSNQAQSNSYGSIQ